MKGTSTKITPGQRSQLMREFSHSPYITPERRVYLSKKLGIKIREIYLWFQRRHNHILALEAHINWNGN